MASKSPSSGGNTPAKKTTAKMAAASKAAVRKAAEKKAASGGGTKKARTASSSRKSQSITTELRHRMIAEAAFLISEQRGFQGDTAMDDWLRAEAEVDARLLENV